MLAKQKARLRIKHLIELKLLIYLTNLNKDKATSKINRFFDRRLNGELTIFIVQQRLLLLLLANLAAHQSSIWPKTVRGENPPSRAKFTSVSSPVKGVDMFVVKMTMSLSLKT